MFAAGNGSDMVAAGARPANGRHARVLVLLTAVALAASPAPGQSPPICCEDFTGPGAGEPDRRVDVTDLLALLAQWATAPATHPSADIAPGSADGCPAGGDGIVDVQDLLALIASWGPCDSAVDDCPGVLDPANTYARISADGEYPFRISGLLDGPQRGPTNNNLEGPCWVNACGWHNYQSNGIPGGFQFGDRFGIDMSTDPFTEGGDVWFHYTASGSGSVFFEVITGTGDGELTEALIDVYPGATCPTDWATRLECLDTAERLFDSPARIIVVPGDVLLVRIGGRLAERGDGALRVTFIDNSQFEQALPIQIGSSLRDSTVGAGVPVAPVCVGVSVAAPGRWYTFVGDGRPLEVSVTCVLSTWPCFGPEWEFFDRRLSLYTSSDGTAAALSCLTAANDDTCGLAETIKWTAKAGQRYYVLVHGTPGLLPPFFSEGPFLLDLWPNP